MCIYKERNINKYIYIYINIYIYDVRRGHRHRAKDGREANHLIKRNKYICIYIYVRIYINIYVYIKRKKNK